MITANKAGIITKAIRQEALEKLKETGPNRIKNALKVLENAVGTDRDGLNSITRFQMSDKGTDLEATKSFILGFQ